MNNTETRTWTTAMLAGIAEALAAVESIDYDALAEDVAHAVANHRLSEANAQAAELNDLSEAIDAATPQPAPPAERIQSAGTTPTRIAAGPRHTHADLLAVA